MFNNIAALAGYPINRNNRNNNPLNDQNDIQTPLHLAVAHGPVEDVRNYLNHGADIEARGDNHQTPLHFAVVSGREEVVAVLLNQGAHTGARNNNNRTPLHLAASQGHLAIVLELLNHGADTTAIDNNNQTPTELANAYGHNEVSNTIEAFESERRSFQILFQYQNQINNPILNVFIANRYPQGFPNRVRADNPYTFDRVRNEVNERRNRRNRRNRSHL